MYGLDGYGSSDDEVAAQVQPEIEMATMASLPAAVARAAAQAAGAPVNPFAMSLVDPVARATNANKRPSVAPPIAPLRAPLAAETRTEAQPSLAAAAAAVAAANTTAA